MAGAGFRTFVDGDVLSAAQVNTYLMEQAVMVFADASARTTALPTPSEGMVTYLADTNVLEVYDGSSWVSIDDPNAIQNSIVDAKGDIITATADNTPARLAAGTNEHRLVADSAQTTGLKYVADTTNYAIAAKGDLLVGTAADTLTNLGVGTNGHILTADSTQTAGVKWAASPAGGATVFITSASPSGVSSVSVDNCFTSTYENYIIIADFLASQDNFVQWRLRASSTDASGSDYFIQEALFDGTGITETRYTDTVYYLATSSTANRAQIYMQVFKPQLAARTGLMHQGVYRMGDAAMKYAVSGGGHLLATSYDGFTFIANTGTITGTIRVYGIVNS